MLKWPAAIFLFLISAMQKIPFIFSNKLLYRIARHFAFWFFAIFGEGLIGVGIRPLFNVEISPGSFMENILEPVLYLPGQLLMVYLLLYFLIPRYILKTKYRQAILWGAALTIVSAFIAAFSYTLLIDVFRAHFLSHFEFRENGKMVSLVTENKGAIDYGQLPFEFLFGFRAVLNVAGFAAAIKLMKYWYEKEYLNSILQKEKLDAELQSLKAQLHPHFLFNTLNNIYSITENTSPVASDILLKLSALLRYILYECDQPLVKLLKECKLIEDYIALEKIRYKEIDLTINLPADTDNHSIAPLLLLPLVENCFKHGTSKMLEQPWININIDIKDDTLLVKLINGKPPGNEVILKEGIGLSNARKRLNLLYPGEHDLTVISEEDVFIVQLKLNLTAASGQAG